MNANDDKPDNGAKLIRINDLLYINFAEVESVSMRKRNSNDRTTNYEARIEMKSGDVKVVPYRDLESRERAIRDIAALVAMINDGRGL